MATGVVDGTAQTVAKHCRVTGDGCIVHRQRSYVVDSSTMALGCGIIAYCAVDQRQRSLVVDASTARETSSGSIAINGGIAHRGGTIVEETATGC